VYFEVFHSYSEVFSTGRSDSYTFRRDDGVRFHVQSNVRPIGSSLRVQPRALSCSRFAGFRADGMPVGAEESKLSLQVLIERPESVVAGATYIVVVQQERALRIGNRGSTLDSKRLSHTA